MKIEHSNTDTPEEAERIVDLLLNGNKTLESKNTDSEENANEFLNPLFEECPDLKIIYNSWYKEYSEKPTPKNSKTGDVILYNGELLINTGAEIIPFTLKKKNNTMTVDKLNELMSTKLKLPKSFLEKSDKCCKTIERVNNIMENYIVINGKKTELTEEQLKALGIEKKRNNPFNTVLNYRDNYFAITGNGIRPDNYISSETDDDCILNANSFNDKDFANQVYLHELLNRKLLKYAWDNEAEDCEWDKGGNNLHYYIYFDYLFNKFMVAPTTHCKNFCVYFSREKVAKQAIKDVIKPFMERYPNFVW